MICIIFEFCNIIFLHTNEYFFNKCCYIVVSQPGSIFHLTSCIGINDYDENSLLFFMLSNMLQQTVFFNDTGQTILKLAGK